MHQGHCDVQAPAHASREGDDDPFGRVAESERREEVGRSRTSSRPPHSVQPPDQFQVLARRHQVVERGVLHRQSDAGAHPLRIPVDPMAGDASDPRRRPRERGEDPDRRRLSGAVASQESEDLAVSHGEGHAVERADPAGIDLLDPLQLDRRVHRRSETPYATSRASTARGWRSARGRGNATTRSIRGARRSVGEGVSGGSRTLAVIAMACLLSTCRSVSYP